MKSAVVAWVGGERMLERLKFVGIEVFKSIKKNSYLFSLNSDWSQLKCWFNLDIRNDRRSWQTPSCRSKLSQWKFANFFRSLPMSLMVVYDAYLFMNSWGNSCLFIKCRKYISVCLCRILNILQLRIVYQEFFTNSFFHISVFFI